MSMDAKLIGKFITQQVAVEMARKTKQYKKKIKKVEKGGKDRVSGESSSKNGTRGGGIASKKDKTSANQTNTKSRPPQKPASQSAQVRKSILRRPLRGRSQKSGNANSNTPRNKKGKKAACSKSTSKSTNKASKTDNSRSRSRSKKR